MIKILSFERAIAARAIDHTEQYGISGRRAAAERIRNGSPLRLVGRRVESPNFGQQRPASRLLRLVRRHPVVVDSLFVAATLGAAALMWRAGW